MLGKYSMSLETLIAQVKQSTDINQNRRNLREQIQADLVLEHAGGLFSVNPTLIAFLASWADPVVFLEDMHGEPVKCDRESMLTQCQQHYQKVMNRWHIQYEQLVRIRKI